MCIWSLLPSGWGNHVVWQRLIDNQVCWNTKVLVGCVMHVEGGEKVDLPLPVPSPCNSVVMVLGTGVSFVKGFVSAAKASIGTSYWEWWVLWY